MIINHGRKAADLVGWTSVNVSVLCFFLASFIRPWAKMLFIIAQGLQGMSGLSLIVDIVGRDISTSYQGDPPLFTRRNVLGTVLGLVFFGMVVAVQYSQITEFGPVWGGLLPASALVLSAMVTVFPETQHVNGRQSHKDLSLIGLASSEFAVYRQVLQKNRFVKPTVAEACFKNLAGGVHIMSLLWMMATFGYNQFELMFMLAPSIVVAIATMGVMPSLCRKHGHRVVYMGVFWCELALDWISIPFLTSSLG